MEFKGRIYKVLPIEEDMSKSGNKYRKQQFVFEYFEHESDRYSDKVLLSVMNDRIEQYDLHEGDEVTIGFGHRVNEVNGRWFNNLSVYKFEKPHADGAKNTGTINNSPAEQSANTGDDSAAKDDDLPF